ncbi:uncharacterized protein LTR77_006201 [Saxophila tyrrhenica]|uniref:Uncharacterized protein n=1 Tax=Saxophila tyrrhenica TaxID=1690608 RepID=A0AAV9PA92_9PEZI|nr:hypothetical protein LTR77_006201 [Saxophila tyrrhenica]
MATSAFTSGTSTPHTPPYTPHRTKRPVSRNQSPASTKNDSPASIRSAIQADSTESPTKKASETEPPKSEPTVSELTEHDAGYIADNETEIVLPNELEEAESSQSDDDPTYTGESESDDDAITNLLSALGCEDSEEAAFEKKRRAKHARRRTESRVFKRPHSLTVNVGSMVTDPEAMADQDLPESARRLRRRTRGPEGMEGVEVSSVRSSAEPVGEAMTNDAPDAGSGKETDALATRRPSDMDVDDA